MPDSCSDTCSDLGPLNDRDRPFELALEAKSELLSMVSHEMRTPLNAILALIEALENDSGETLGQCQSQRVSGIRSASNRLLRIIEQLLGLGRLETVGFENLDASFDAVAALKECIELMEPIGQQRGIDLEIEVSEGTFWVLTDREGFITVVQNLLSNAIKYSPDGSTVRVAVSRHTSKIRIEVLDQGPGISEANRQRLFTPFDRLGASSGQIEGSGLGLAISQSYLQAMSSSLAMNRLADKGSCFSFELESISCNNDSQDELPCTSETSVESFTIVYAEDDRFSRVLLSKVLSDVKDWKVIPVADASQAWRVLTDRQPDILLTDINLADASGLSLVKRVRETPELTSTVCIALSGDSHPGHMQRCLDGGFDEYWVKPIPPDTLIQKLRRIIATKWPQNPASES